ncbi:MAG: hypothetical protein ACD_28C00207G0002 [uncultured bacterium]|nr:MAG: hypothetical protein ACD_28C00207G0002 [uncultured bacterium]
MKIAVLASGGVDSSVALHLLKEQGHELTVFYLKIWLEDELSYLGECPWEEDLGYVRAICDRLDVPLQVIPLQKEYWDEVIRYTLVEVKAGRTPNPDVLCNQKIKFGKFYERIDASFEKVATGHYARVEEKEGVFFLKTAKDTWKDQTYFLAHLSQSQLSRALFPIGDYLKSEVRELAKKYELPNADRKDSQGICFLGSIPFDEFVKHHLGEKQGELVEFETGKVLGCHQGYWYYTIGQRKGIGLSGGPWFVVSKDIVTNRVFISNHYHVEDKPRNCFRAHALHWISGEPVHTQAPLPLKVKIRHGQQRYDATLKWNGNEEVQVELVGSDQGLAPGQFAVFYEGEICRGIATIVGE